jgi:4-hydroxythreonine-4-phosphate dehydrogenase
VVSTLATALAAAGVRPSALVATGGETARAVSQALGVTRIDLAGQLEPGVVYGRFADGPACPVVTKAGTFGDEGSLIRAVRALRRPEPLTTLHGEEA